MDMPRAEGGFVRNNEMIPDSFKTAGIIVKNVLNAIN